MPGVNPSTPPSSPPKALFDLPPLSVGMAGCDDAGSLTQAKYELHRAQDFGGEADLARWAERWGPGLLNREPTADDAGIDSDDLDAELHTAVVQLEGVLDILENKELDVKALIEGVTEALDAIKRAETEVDNLCN